MSITESDKEKAYEIIRSTYVGGEYGSPTRGTVDAIAAAIAAERERAHEMIRYEADNAARYKAALSAVWLSSTLADAREIARKELDG